MIEAEERPPAPALARGLIEEDDPLEEVEVEVPPGTGRVVFELAWANHWGVYPTDNLDLFVVDPAGNVILEGWTIRCPERVVVDEPMPGLWRAYVSSSWEAVVHGVHGGDAAHWTLRVTDGNGETL